MSDQKKWFKVWASILMDNNFQNMRMEDKGRWLILGALVCQQGEKGMIRFYPPALILCQMFSAVTFDALIVSLKYLEKCNVRTALHEDGSVIITIKNWYKYQRDDSKDRVRKFRLRAKRNVTHQEERRREVTPTSTSTPRATRSGSANATPGATRETATPTPEELETQEANRAWKQNTEKSLPESEIMSPEEMREIRLRNLGTRKNG